VSDRLSSGLPQLDALLGGGLPANALTLVAGEPGTGKTILAQHFVFHNATPERPALYCTTVSESLDKLLRYGQTLDFFDVTAVGSSVFFEDLGAVATQPEGLAAVLERLDILLQASPPAIVVIDSFKALHAFARNRAEYRRFLHELVGRLSVLAASTFLLGEYAGEGAQGAAAEFAVADTIISLTSERHGYRTARYLEVLKMRGSDYHSGAHAYRISPAGMRIFPRIADPLDASGYEQATSRVSSGIGALDELLHDGYWPGASTLVAGPTGSGKTLMGLHFLFHGAASGEPGVLATLQESRAHLTRIVEGFGWSLDDAGVEVYSRSPVDLLIDEWLHGVLEAVQQTGARRLVVDSIDDLLVAAGDSLRFREYMYSLVQRCARLQVSLLMTHEVSELFDLVQLSEFGVSHLSDNVVLLQYVRAGDELRRAITVLKTRASAHEPLRRQFRIAEGGIRLVEPLLQPGALTP
jgi:circadian clock protein KaiC